MLFTTFLQHLGEIRISGAGSRSGSILGSLQGAFWESFVEPLGSIEALWAPFGALWSPLGSPGVPLGPLGRPLYGFISF